MGVSNPRVVRDDFSLGISCHNFCKNNFSHCRVHSGCGHLGFVCLSISDHRGDTGALLVEISPYVLAEKITRCFKI